MLLQNKKEFDKKSAAVKCEAVSVQVINAIGERRLAPLICELYTPIGVSGQLHSSANNILGDRVLDNHLKEDWCLPESVWKL